MCTVSLLKKPKAWSKSNPRRAQWRGRGRIATCGCRFRCPGRPGARAGPERCGCWHAACCLLCEPRTRCRIVSSNRVGEQPVETKSVPVQRLPDIADTIRAQDV